MAFFSFALAVALVTQAHGGTIVGTATFHGKASAPKAFRIARNLQCGKMTINDNAVLLSKDGKALQNVHVRIVNAPHAELSTSPVVLDQIECAYTPRVLGAMIGQPIVIKNSQNILHNVHAQFGRRTLFNLGQPAGSADIQRTAPGGIDVMTFKCDIHPWMRAYILISEHPYFAVTNQTGRFKISHLPPGQYTLEAWHEKFGTQTVSTSVEEDRQTEVVFRYPR